MEAVYHLYSDTIKRVLFFQMTVDIAVCYSMNMKVSSHKEDLLVLVALLAEKDRFVFM
jgi:hypothetical protein